MYTFTSRIDPDGCLVDALVGLSWPVVQKLRAAGNPVPAPVAVRALLDSGAEITCIEPQALAPLVQAGLRLGIHVLANVPALSGLTLAGQYYASLTIVHPCGNPQANLVLRNLPILEQPLGKLGYQALIGRDVLSSCLFIMDGPGAQFTLGY